MLTVGLVGLPNVGKSTLFNALAKAGARVSNYPFTTIEANIGVAEVPDPRLGELRRLLEPDETVPCFIEFTDVAGLVEGASRGEGLGNQFLGDIRAVDAVVHLLRCFEQADVAHVFATLDPLRDAGVVETELLLADLELLTRSIAKRSKIWTTDPAAHAAERSLLERCREELEAGRPLRDLHPDRDQAQQLKALGLLTAKPVVWVANLSEDDAGGEPPAIVDELRRGLGAVSMAEVVALSAQLELELADLDAGERAEFLEVLGLTKTGLEELVGRCFDLLGLVRFYTVANRKLRAWEIPRGTLAPQAAGKVHTQMETGFVRARVAAYAEVMAAGGMVGLRDRGKLRTEGKQYEIQDGDVVEFLFTQ